MKNMKYNKILSVIIPAYNVEKYLKESVDSVLSQTVLPHEVIIINDGSTDNTGKIAEDLYGHYANVKIIHTRNNGLGEARNIGTRIATGDFVYYFDSDDILQPDLVESFYGALIQQPDLEIYYFSANSFLDDSWSQRVANSKKLQQFGGQMERIFATGEKAFVALVKNKMFSVPVWLYICSRHLLLKKSLTFRSIIYEDEEFTLRLFFMANKTIVTKKVFLRYRVRLGSIMQSSCTEQNIVGYLYACFALEDLLLTCASLESKKYIKKRIITYISIMLNMKYTYALKLSSKVIRDLNMVVSKYGGLRMSVVKYTLWICQFVKDKLRSH